eukprot:7687071-Pyramimonas_sp.AAC.1
MPLSRLNVCDTLRRAALGALDYLDVVDSTGGCGPLRHELVVTYTQSDAGSAGIFSRRTDRVYIHRRARISQRLFLCVTKQGDGRGGVATGSWRRSIEN